MLFQKHADRKERARLQIFVDTHNAQVVPSNSETKKAMPGTISEKSTASKGKKPDIDPHDLPTNKDYGKAEEELDKRIERIAVPYTEPLPPVPDATEAKLFFIDENDNGVRDDVEIDIVEEFQEDKAMVESFFAGVQLQEYKMYLAENDLLSEEQIQIALDNTGKYFSCGVKYSEDTEYFDDGDDKYFALNAWTDFSVNYNHTIYLNTSERSRLYEKFKEKTGGHAINGAFVSQYECKKIYSEIAVSVTSVRNF